MKRRILLTILSFLIFFSSNEKLDAYHPDVHRKITTSTLEQMTSRLDTYMNDSIGEKGYLKKMIWGKTTRAWIEDGSWWKDLSVGSHLDLLTSHYYNPYTNANAINHYTLHPALPLKGLIFTHKFHWRHKGWPPN